MKAREFELGEPLRVRIGSGNWQDAIFFKPGKRGHIFVLLDSEGIGGPRREVSLEDVSSPTNAQIERHRKNRTIYPNPIANAAKAALGEVGDVPDNADLPFLVYRDEIASKAAAHGYEAGQDDAAKLFAARVEAWFETEMRTHPRCDYAAWCAYFKPKLAEILK